MQISLHAFWSSAYSEPFFSRFIEYFGHLFSHPDVVERYDVVEVWSVFGGGQKPCKDTEQRVLRVQFSGEGYYLDPSLFDINLIPCLEDATKGIVPHALAGIYIYTSIYQNDTCKLLDLLQRPRIWNEANHDARRFCTFIVSNGGPKERKAFFARLSKFKRVDSCGRFLKNWSGKVPEPDTLEYLDFLSQFRFMLCFENCRVDHYLTEKLINAYAGGTIPIYWGCPQALEYFNPKAFLILDEKASVEGFERLFERVVALENDKNAYKEMYEQPLFKDGARALPSCMQMEALRDSIRNTLIKS